MEEISLFSLPVKKCQTIDFFLPKLKDKVIKIMPVQKQTCASQCSMICLYLVFNLYLLNLQFNVFLIYDISMDNKSSKY